MKTLAYVSVLLALAAFILGLVEKLGISVMHVVSPVGYIKAATIFLLFGMNFALLEMLNRK